jgi:hypothetical protein
MEMNPRDPILWNERAIARAHLGKIELAIDDLTKVSRLDPKLLEQAKYDLDYETLWEHPRFEKLVGGLRP